MKNDVLLGLCPIGKVLFSHEDSVRQKVAVQKKLLELGVRYVDLDGVLPETDGLICRQDQCDKVTAYFKSQGVDAVFLPHCSFGTEGAAGIIARDAGVPVLLWGPRDEAPLPDGTRLRDTLCGLLPSSKVIRKLTKGKFSYIGNCTVNDGEFASGLDTFLRTAAVVKAARHMRIGHIGARIDFFWCCTVNESELLERFGIEIKPFEIGEVLRLMEKELADNGPACKDELTALRASWLDDTGMEEAELLNGIALSHVLADLKEEYNLSVFTTQNFFSLSRAIGPGGSLFTLLANEIIPIANESDIHGAISLALIQAAKTKEEQVFFPEFVVRHPEDDNAVCLWHVGAPTSLRHESVDKINFMPPWILPGDRPSQAQMRLKNGPLTVCRFDGDWGEYRLGVGEGQIVDGPYTRDYYGWFKVNDWPRWEKQLIQGPYIHHLAAAYGHCADALLEAAKYLEIETEEFGR